MPSLAVILGCEGPILSADERAFFREIGPFGFILFARNVEDPAQLRRLTADLRECVGREDAPVLIDQEGGRVQRLRPPHWRNAPAMRLFGDIYRSDPARACEALALNIQLIAAELVDAGITVDCAPLLDVSTPETHSAIGDRALSADVETVCELGRLAADSFLANGVFPVMKHVPGHGRATVDSHKDLPRVTADLDRLNRVDFEPFRHLRDVPFAMTAHIVYEAIDPVRPATLSDQVIHQIIRGNIGFDGLLISDDLSMHALTGDFESRSRECLAAGCDLALHCNGDRAEMEQVVQGASALTEDQWGKWLAAKRRLDTGPAFDRSEALDRFNRLIGAPL